METKKLIFLIILATCANSNCALPKKQKENKNRTVELIKGWGAKILALTGVGIAANDILKSAPASFLLKDSCNRLGFAQGMRLEEKFNGLDPVDVNVSFRPIKETPSCILGSIFSLGASAGLVYACYKIAQWGNKILEQLEDGDE